MRVCLETDFAIGLTEAYLNGTPGSLTLRSEPSVGVGSALTMVKADCNIIRTGGSPVRTLTADRYGVQGLRVSNDLSRRSASVKHERMGKPSSNQKVSSMASTAEQLTCRDLHRRR